MEFFYYCATCHYYLRNTYEDPPYKKAWCFKHERRLPPEVGGEQLICCDFEPRDPRAVEFENSIKSFPKGELWTFLLYYPSRKFANIADLPKVDPDTGLDRVE